MCVKFYIPFQPSYCKVAGLFVMMASSPKNDLFGYVQGISHLKKAKTSQPYFNFEIQTGEQEWHRAVCFSETMLPTIKSLSESQSPVHLTNVRKSPRKDDPLKLEYIFSSRSKIAKSSNKDVPFNFEMDHNSEQLQVQVKDLSTIHQGQLVEIKGRIEMDEEATIQTVYLNNKEVQCIEEVLITDETGSFPITVWGDLIHTIQVGNGQNFHLQHVRVKQYKGEKRLTTTPQTTVVVVHTTDYPHSDPDQMQKFHLTELYISEIRMAENFRRFAICKRCQKFLTDEFTQNVLKCGTCNAVQRPTTCPIRYDIQLHVDDEESNPVKLTAFEDIIQLLLDKYNSRDDRITKDPVSLQSPDDDIYNAVLSLNNILIQYKNTHVITQVT